MLGEASMAPGRATADDKVTVLSNAVVRTMVSGAAPAEAVAWRDGRIIAVGSNAEARAAAGEGAAVLDARGRTVVPGFIDAHHHLAQAVLYSGVVHCGPEQAPRIAALQELLAAEARRLPPGAWILAHGYDEWRLAERRHPRRDDLDEACPENPVLLVHYSFHEAVASSRALSAVGIDRHTPDPPAGIIIRGAGGIPTGRLVETATARIERVARDSVLHRDFDGFIERLAPYEDRLFAAGITRVCDPTVPASFEKLYRALDEQGRLRIPVVMMPVSSDGLLLPPEDRMDGAPTGEGPEHLRVGPLKLFFDGANRCAMCLSVGQLAGATMQLIMKTLRSGSRDALRNSAGLGLTFGRDLKARTGVHYYGRRQALDLAQRACERGFSIAIHAIGNEAVARATEVLAAVRGRHGDVPPPRIEHGSVVTAELARRAANDGIAVVTQPSFLTLPAFEELPKPPGLRIIALRTLLDAGVCVAGSSDAPVTGFEPLSAMTVATKRCTASGAPLQPEEAISAEEALAMYTREAARAAGSLDVAGTLEAGKRADLVVLSSDPYRPQALEPGRTRVDWTFLGGRLVHAAGSAGLPGTAVSAE